MRLVQRRRSRSRIRRTSVATRRSGGARLRTRRFSCGRSTSRRLVRKGCTRWGRCARVVRCGKACVRTLLTSGSSGCRRAASRTEGQLLLPVGVRCTLGEARILRSDVGRTAGLTGDRESAATALLQRAVLRAESPIDPLTVLAAERAIVRDRFGRSAARYRSALSAAKLTLADARSIISDRLARDQVEERFRPPAATAAQIAEFLGT